MGSKGLAEDVSARRAITNVSVGDWYPRGQDRLALSARDVGFGGDLLMYRNEYPPGCPTHQQEPYAFKHAAFDVSAARGNGATLWADSSVWFIKPLDVLFAEIEQNGYWVMTQGWQVGTWCTDEALPKLGIEREASFEMVMVTACMYGLDVTSDVGREILAWMRARCTDGSFRGPWKREAGFVSEDKRVLGHRHDQTALSVIVHKLGLKVDWCPGYLRYDYDGTLANPEAVALARGM